MNFPYEDIVHLPHHVSKKHKPMSRLNRAAQFAPFAALTGYDDEVKEAARLTDDESSLPDGNIALMNRYHQILLENLANQPEVTFVYFVPDKRKKGGVYESKTGKIRKIDEFERQYILTDGTKIEIDHLFSMECELFDNLIKD